MPRGCGCAGNSCGCQIVAGPGTSVTGTGNASDPYIIGTAQPVYLTYTGLTIPNTLINLTGILDTNGVVYLDMEADTRIMFSTVAPIGTRVQVVTTQSFGSKLIPDGNVRTESGLLLGVAPDQYFPIPTTGQGWIDAVKASPTDWFVRYAQDMVI